MSNGQTGCAKCETGYFQASTGRSVCDQCAYAFQFNFSFLVFPQSAKGFAVFSVCPILSDCCVMRVSVVPVPSAMPRVSLLLSVVSRARIRMSMAQNHARHVRPDDSKRIRVNRSAEIVRRAPSSMARAVRHVHFVHKARINNSMDSWDAISVRKAHLPVNKGFVTFLCSVMVSSPFAPVVSFNDRQS
jgi:hypothetical protein